MLKTLSCTTGWYFTTLPDWPAHEPHAQIAAGLAVVVLVTKVATRYLVYRSPKRYVVHAIMHTCGSEGSVLLLV
jgi:hypothetical protein